MSDLEKTRDVGARTRAKWSIIKEIILENFMSYEYSRIPFGPGLNLICGPNGAGKSSILLAISVVLGQTYTERSRKLSDLIRRGKDLARVSIILDNSPREGGRRPIPYSRSETFMLSRYLKRDGSYWYEGDFHEMSKGEVSRLLTQFGINPENPLIIMHQGMVEEFSVTSPPEKLVMVEESVGFDRYRKNLLEAQRKLEGLVSEETATLQLMENAGQTLEYWKGIYGKYVQKKSLLERKRLLERELFWSQVTRLEKTLESGRERLESRLRVLENTIEKLKKTSESAEDAWSRLSASRTELRKFYFSLSRLEKGVGEMLSTQKTLSAVSHQLEEKLKRAEDLLLRLGEGRTSEAVQVREHLDSLRYVVKDSAAKSEEGGRKVKDLESEVTGIQGEIGKSEDALTQMISKFVDLKVSEALLSYQKKNVEREVAELRKSLKETEDALQQLMPQQPEGGRVSTERTQLEVGEELKIAEVHLRSLDDVPEEAETIYTNYSSIHQELEQKLRVVRENKQLVLRELEERRKVWKETLTSLVEEINPIYQTALTGVSASGLIRLTNMEDTLEAGLELLVGFRGSSPVALDAYTQSGGERSVSVMAFLMSLQNRIVSPFRAIDEFDVHMDPRNREAMMNMLFSQKEEQGEGQNIVITPSQITVLDQDVNLIFVQSTQGRSHAEGVKRAKQGAG